VATVASQPECDALVGLYQATDGPNWTNHSGWNTPTDPCTWHGVTCSPAGVTKLDVYGNNLTGSVPASIGGLTNVTVLTLSDNHLTSLPNEIGNLTSLEKFYMEANPLPVLPPGIGNLHNLTDLWVIQDHLTALPPQFGNLTKLETFDMSGNYVTALPVEFGNLASLKSATIWANRLTGDITAQMAGIKDTLQYLGISDGPGFNNCLTISDPFVAAWMDGMDKNWKECDAGLPGANVIVIGGPAAVPQAALAKLATLTHGSVSRVYGANRYATAAAISKAVFSPGVSTVYAATGENFPDALAAGPAAGGEGAPILLVRNGSVPSETAQELIRLKPGRIVVVGGTAVVSNTVMSQLAAYTTGPVIRIAGPNRYATAAAVSASAFSPGVGTAIIATGMNFPDALAGGPAGVEWGGPVLLVQQNAIPASTMAELQRLHPGRIVVLGGTSAVSASVAGQLASLTAGPVVRYSGPNRYATAAAVSKAMFPTGTGTVFVAIGTNFPDAVAAGPAASLMHAPILLVDGSTGVPQPTSAEVQRLGG